MEEIANGFCEPQAETVGRAADDSRCNSFTQSRRMEGDQSFLLCRRLPDRRGASSVACVAALCYERRKHYSVRQYNVLMVSSESTNQTRRCLWRRSVSPFPIRF